VCSGIVSLVALTSGTSFASTTYTVQSGDTLWGISTQYHITVDQLEHANHLSSTNLQIGQPLSVPGSGDSTKSSNAHSDVGSYVVKSGDTLWGIARDHNESVSEIMAANSLDSNLLQIGQHLALNGHTKIFTTASSRSVFFANLVAVKNSSNAEEHVVDLAKQLIGTGYVWGGDSPKGFDCSGFVSYVMGEAGHSLPRSTYDQVNSGIHVSRSELEAGDLVFFNTGDGVSHVGIYIGNGLFVHADSSAGVTETSINDPYYWSSRYVTARRIL